MSWRRNGQRPLRIGLQRGRCGTAGDVRLGRRNLPERTDSGKPRGALPLVGHDGWGAPRKVQARGATAKLPTLNGDSEWTADLEHVWRERMAPVVASWERRRRRSAREGSPARARYAGSRATSISMARADVVASCGQRWRTVGCGCGRRDVVVGCDQPMLCATCRKRHWRRWRHRITKALRTHSRAAVAAWGAHGGRGPRPGIYLVTLTGPHTGDLPTDRERLGRAVRVLLKHAAAAGWWRHYALVWECTKGDDGLGHMHAHIAVIASWIPYDELHSIWRCAMPGARVLNVKAPRGADRAKPGSAANYLSKYVTKGVEPSDMTGQKAGELLVATYGKRRVTTSRGFWIESPPTCKDCGRRCYLHRAPIGLARRNPAGVVRALVTRLAPRLREIEHRVRMHYDDRLREVVIDEVVATVRRHPQKRMLD